MTLQPTSKVLLIMKESGSTLGIGRGYDSLGPMPIGGPKIFLRRRVHIEAFGLWGVYIVKFTKRHKY